MPSAIDTILFCYFDTGKSIVQNVLFQPKATIQ
jgi:hypothetical protein